MRLVVYIIIFFLFPSVCGWAKSDKNTGKKVLSEDYSRLQAAIDSRDKEAVVKAASIILDKDSENLKALNGLGVFYFYTGKFGIAKLIYRRALKSHGDKSGLHNNLGIIHLEEGDLRKALVAFRKSVSIGGASHIAEANLGSIFVQNKDYSRSIAPLESGYKSVQSDLSPKNTSAIHIANNYAVALIGIGQGQKAESIFKKALDKGVNEASLLYNYAVLLVNILKNRGEGLRIVSKLKFSTDRPEILRKVQELEQRLDKL